MPRRGAPRLSGVPGVIDVRRVAITGLGAVSALGIGVAPFWARVVDGASGVARITHFDPSGYLAQVAAEAPALDGLFDETELAFLDRFPQLALVAPNEPWGAAGVALTAQRHARARAP